MIGEDVQGGWHPRSLRMSDTRLARLAWNRILLLRHRHDCAAAPNIYMTTWDSRRLLYWCFSGTGATALSSGRAFPGVASGHKTGTVFQ